MVGSPYSNGEGARAFYGLTDTTENIIFLELCWRAVKSSKLSPTNIVNLTVDLNKPLKCTHTFIDYSGKSRIQYIL